MLCAAGEAGVSTPRELFDLALQVSQYCWRRPERMFRQQDERPETQELAIG